MIKAAIDIGTNSVKLLIADVVCNQQKGHRFTVLYEKSIQTRLGRGLYQSKVINGQARSDTLEVLNSFKQIIDSFDCRHSKIIATSAMRDAKNGQEFAEEISSSIHIPVEIISGAEEARLSFQGVSYRGDCSDSLSLLIDVGGGSTELVFGRNESVLSFSSLELGSVRCFENMPVSDPPQEDEFIQCKQSILEIINQDQECLRAKESFEIHHAISTGGTAAAIACISRETQELDRELIDRMEISVDDLVTIRQRLWSAPLSERREIPGIPKKKADILLMGVLIHEVVFEFFGAKILCPSTKGLRYGALLES